MQTLISLHTRCWQWGGGWGRKTPGTKCIYEKQAAVMCVPRRSWTCGDICDTAVPAKHKPLSTWQIQAAGRSLCPQAEVFWLIKIAVFLFFFYSCKKKKRKKKTIKAITKDIFSVRFQFNSVSVRCFLFFFSSQFLVSRSCKCLLFKKLYACSSLLLLPVIITKTPLTGAGGKKPGKTARVTQAKGKSVECNGCDSESKPSM